MGRVIHREAPLRTREYRYSISEDQHTTVPVKLAFATRELREICESQLAAEHEYGIEAARQLRRLLEDLLTADSLQDLLVEDMPESPKSADVDFEVQLAGGHVMLVSINQRTARRSTLSEIDRSKVRRVIVRAIRKSEVDGD